MTTNEMDTASEYTEAEMTAELSERSGAETENALPPAENANALCEADMTAAEAEVSEPDYAAIMAEDMARLRAAFPECGGLRSLAELRDPIRYGALRDMGLTPEEAYAATSYRTAPRYDNRTHLRAAVRSVSAASGSTMSPSELESARELFGSLSDTEIASLYRRACGMKR